MCRRSLDPPQPQTKRHTKYLPCPKYHIRSSRRVTPIKPRYLRPFNFTGLLLAAYSIRTSTPRIGGDFERHAEHKFPSKIPSAGNPRNIAIVRNAEVKSKVNG